VPSKVSSFLLTPLTCAVGVYFHFFKILHTLGHGLAFTHQLEEFPRHFAILDKLVSLIPLVVHDSSLHVESSSGCAGPPG